MTQSQQDVILSPSNQKRNAHAAPAQKLQEHTCEYCTGIFLSERLNNTGYRAPSTVTISSIEAAYRAGCTLFIALVYKLVESGRELEDLLPYPTVFQDWDTSRYQDGYQDGRHVTLHLARGDERFCDGVAYKLFSPDSIGHCSPGASGNSLETIPY